ncbi:acetyl-CoA acetyltransferase [candidate division LCP-89 bacterium B3_LCP]|uniref:Acetyl-CoA acetyltransferase n=1 Tax=candidate division LCP-89 bacterium B3_LCP TaxID=2012998 RepID=A0A532V3D9_UNCL8|nr:MAG: acetyl-CoA acetyltransferase [candidate division LCP-89 bacterium B3_LCP]
MANLRDVVIVSAVRTPIGCFLGSLSTVPAPRLGAVAIKAALERAHLDPEQVDEVIMGCVLAAGVGQAPARQAMIYAGIPRSAGAMTINKVCGSGLKSVMLAAQSIQCGEADIVVAGGMENMSLVPFYSLNGRTGFRMGHAQLTDGMIFDGLWDIYNNFHMGSAAELCAKEFNITREDQDAYATESYTRAQAAIADGKFKAEIVPVEVPGRKGLVTVVEEDEEPGKGNVSKFTALRSAFMRNGTVTAANASSINDGAAAVIMMSAEKAKDLGLKPLAKFVAHATASKDPEWFTTAPTDAINKLLKKTKLSTDDIDLYEINEAFSVVSVANNQLLGLDPDKVNVKGGAVALGHPIGASGTRILVTLLYAMKDRKAKRGLAALCIGGGEAVTAIVER